MSPIDTIRSRRREISREIERLHQEEQELAVAENVLARIEGKASPAAVRAAQVERAEQAKPKTQRECVLAALAAAETPWLRTRDIIDASRERWGIEIAEKSLRPLMTGLKKERVIVRDGRLVALRQRAGEAKRGAPGPRAATRQSWRN